MTTPIEDTDAIFQRVLFLFDSPVVCNFRILSAVGLAAWQAAGPKAAWHPFFLLRLCCILTRDRCNGSLLQEYSFFNVSDTRKATERYFSVNTHHLMCASLSLRLADKLLVEAVLKYIPNVQTHSDCLQTFLSLYLPRRF